MPAHHSNDKSDITTQTDASDLLALASNQEKNKKARQC